MEIKHLAIVLAALMLLIAAGVNADFWYNRPLKVNKVLLAEGGMTCVPGRTTIKIEAKNYKVNKGDSSADEDEDSDHKGNRRSHMNYVKSESDSCKVCVCSIEGKDEYCSKRPAYNVNECLKQQMLLSDSDKNRPFDHERTLAYRTRRGQKDYIWHDDEIPYASRARCQRAHSYYTNNPNANNTDIDQPSDMNSYLDYKGGADICYYCICSVNGQDIYCVRRDLWFCEYYRYVRQPDAMREMYSVMFKQDRPTYFRQLSWRLRRTMDDGIYALIDRGGDAVCCDHPAGHRRSLHNRVRNKVWMSLRRKIPKENLLNGGPSVQEVDQSKGCIPYVSQYTDCSEANICTGCTRCVCSEDGAWICDRVSECKADPMTPVDDQTLDNALDTLFSKIGKDTDADRKQIPEAESMFDDGKSNEELLLGHNDEDIEMQIVKLISSNPRHKRSLKTEDHPKIKTANDTIKFYHTVDEINEDTLKTSNLSGTLGAAKVEPLNLPNLSRRTASMTANASNDLTLDSLSKINLHHIADNKIDISHGNETIELLYQEKIGIKTNHSQKQKDRDLSKLIVNELKGGKEHIGDIEAPVMSNITFTPENDTLTAMAFIAGNLLNKLWSMEKAASGESLETEALKQEKIADLLDLFKEPLTFRQESFLRNALGKLSEAIENKKDVNDYSVCESIANAKNTMDDPTNHTSKVEVSQNNIIVGKATRSLPTQKPVTNARLKDIKSLISKFDAVNTHLKNLKGLGEIQEKPHVNLRSNHFTENKSENPFGTILEKITKLLLPSKHVKSMLNSIRKQTVLEKNDHDVKRKFKNAFNFDLENMTLTAKDKLVLDYLTKIKADPSLLFNSDSDTENSQLPNIEGDILLNLSEFFKVKSFIDLMKLLDADKRNPMAGKPSLRTVEEDLTSSTSMVEIFEIPTSTSTPMKEISTSDPIAFVKTKEKLKKHLKTILEDLVELQKEQGINSKSKNIKITDALPCIYNLLHASEGNPNKISKDEGIKDLSTIFKAMKNELKDTQNSRRTLDAVTMERPKSAAVWERVVKNVDNLQKKVSRRISYDVKPKSYSELKKMIDMVESNSKLYKTSALESDVPAADKLMLLKTLEQDVKQYIEVMENIKLSLESNKLTSDQYKELKEFISNAGSNLKLNQKVAKTLDKAKTSPKKLKNNLIPRLNKKINFKEQMRLASLESLNEPRGHATDVKFTRNELLNQLIRNRVNQFLMDKVERGDYSVDINDGIARNILENFNKGNDQLARELYKIFVNNKLITPDPDFRRQKIFQKEPLLQFSDPNLLPVPMSVGMNTKSNSMLRHLLDVRNTKRNI